jgi:hypothetical protein
LQRYDQKTLIERGRGESASHIDLRNLTPTKDRPARDRHDLGFFPALNAINTAVAKHDVTLRAFSAYRSQTTQGVKNKKVKNSNHMAGHAIDFDFVYRVGGRQRVCNWPCLRKVGDTCQKRDPAGCLEQAADASGTKPGTVTKGMRTLPEPVLKAILEVEQAGYRWGGRFSSTGFDPIHFDDDLFRKHKGLWEQRVKELAATEAALKKQRRDCPAQETCNVRQGVCECDAGQSCPDGQDLDQDTCECICRPISCPFGQEQDPETCDCAPVCTCTAADHAACRQESDPCTRQALQAYAGCWCSCEERQAGAACFDACLGPYRGGVRTCISEHPGCVRVCGDHRELCGGSNVKPIVLCAR